ncbi:hypothetical protein [Isoptericola dokdonensis]|uniref:Uncharacterized protein n=1 Tax=Isoptericola dokdonensis DS-3 TaxID=1300344 RepID=A0A168EAT6_9MICO|nr:hypothetical protein [Isoptericola dokdonensis]ANC29816.1 hypothetical protein I598_0225 [Isoptericola dokdonensis DS-3]
MIASYVAITTPDSFEIPTVVGMTYDEADAAIAAAYPQYWGNPSEGAIHDMSPFDRSEHDGEDWVIYSQFPNAGEMLSEPQDYDSFVDYYVLPRAELEWFEENPTMPVVKRGPYAKTLKKTFGPVQGLTVAYWKKGKAGRGGTEKWAYVFRDGTLDWTAERPAGETASERQARLTTKGSANVEPDLEKTIVTGRTIPAAGEPLRPGQLILIEAAVIPPKPEPEPADDASSSGGGTEGGSAGGSVSVGGGGGGGGGVDFGKPRFCSRTWWC